MATLDCCGLLENVGMWFDSITVDEVDNRLSFIAHSRHGDSHLAVVTGTVLTIATSLPGSKYEVVCEMEFENPIELVCWGVDASCIIAGDKCGTLHFITPSGQLIFSHRILPSRFFFRRLITPSMCKFKTTCFHCTSIRGRGICFCILRL